MRTRFAGPARAGTFAALFALASGFVWPLVAPSPAAAMGPVPACRYDDIMTSPRDYDDWSVTLVDTILRLPGTYVPPDLVHVSEAGIPGKGQVRAVMIDDLRAMNEAAVAADAAIAVASAYRSFAKQKEVFQDWVDEFGRPRALEVSARPGHSEHQLGLGLDFRSHPGGTPFEGDWGTTKAGQWMKAHSWEFGFVLSYPKGKQDIACYEFEPWHFRYVGRDVAAGVQASGLTLREYLWIHYTTTIVAGPTLPPGATPGPSAGPSAGASEVPAPGASPGASGGASPMPAESATAPAPSATSTPAAATPPAIPQAPAPTVDGSVGMRLEPGVAASLALGAVGLLFVIWRVLRRGRSP